VGFDSGRWETPNIHVTEHLGRESLSGFAYLADVEMETGVVEVDLAVTGSRSYPGIVFHMESERDYEEIYVRPHRAGLYPDAVQYMPVLNGIGCWQLYSGEGYTAPVELPTDRWVHLRLEFTATQARLYIDGSDEPVLTVPHLKHHVSTGGIGFRGPTDGTAFFSDFQYRDGTDLVFPPAWELEMSPGAITEWELSQTYKFGEIELEEHPADQELASPDWRPVPAEPPGLVVVAREFGRTGREPDCVLARTLIRTEEARTLKLEFGYSDAMSLFLNRRLLFMGTSAYRSRDPSFLGIVGLHDVVFLPLREGENEILLIVAESFGGWGFMCRDGDAVFVHEALSEAYSTADTFLTPECVVSDPAQDVLYVSNYDPYGRADASGGQYVSRLSRAGEVLDLKWAIGLSRPTGMAVVGDTLFVVQRTGLAVIETGSGRVVGERSIPDSRFLNDIAADGQGRLYVSDSTGDVVYRCVDGVFESWISGGDVDNPNGLAVHDEVLLVGNNGDNRLKSVDLKTGSVRTVAQLGPGVIDGVAVTEDGNYLVSQWEGRLYRVSPDGSIDKLLDTSAPGVNLADFEYVAATNSVFIPTFYDNRVIAYGLGE
jgi:hypothetical protein